MSVGCSRQSTFTSSETESGITSPLNGKAKLIGIGVCRHHMKISFTVDGNPFGWQRAGQNHYTGAVYTQNKTRQHEQLVALAYRLAAKGYMFPADTYVDLEVIAYVKIPKSATKARRAKMLSGKIRPTTKPDWDNLGKLVSDALNGVAYDDDKRVVDARVRKFYSDRPRTQVTLSEAVNE